MQKIMMQSPIVDYTINITFNTISVVNEADGLQLDLFYYNGELIKSNLLSPFKDAPFHLREVVSARIPYSDFFINTSTSQPYTLTCTSSDCTVKYVKALDTRTWQICFSPITRNLTLTIGIEQ